MNFFSNRIVNPTGDAPTFDEWLNKYLAKEASQKDKTASEAAPGLGQDMGDEPRGQQRGQVINNDNEDGAGYQKGESVDGKPDQGSNARKDAGGENDQKDNSQSDKESGAEVKTVEAGKEMGVCDGAGEVTENHSESAPAGDEKTDSKQLINNDPNYQKGESTNPSKGKSDEKKAQTKGFQKVSSMTRTEKLKLFKRLAHDKSNPLAYIEAMTGVKVANMTDEEKSWFKDFWSILYPESYASEMAADR